MHSDDFDRLTAQYVTESSDLDTIFDLFEDQQTILVELDTRSRVVRSNAGYQTASRCEPGALEQAFPPDVFGVKPVGTGTASVSTEAQPDTYPYIALEEWHSGREYCRVRWLKLWVDSDGERFVKLGIREPTVHSKPDSVIVEGEANYNQLQAFLDAAPDAIITINDRGSMCSVNPATEKLFGYSATELLHQNVSTLMPSPDRERHDGYINRYLDTGEARIIGIGRDIIAKRKDGSTFPARLSVSEFTANGKRFFTGILHDITERIEAEEQQRAMFAEHAHASRVVALGEMASGIAHEINQPLTAIVSYADASRKLIDSGRYDPETLSHALKEISGQGQRAGGIIRRLRDFVRKKAPSRSSADVNELVRTAAAFTHHDVERYGIDLELNLEPKTLYAEVDRLQIEQVVLNLIRNSIDAINESQSRDGRVQVSTRLDGDTVSILVKDNGPGIKPSEYGNVFDAFYTTKDTGTGLGLSISHLIVETHGGSLTFRPNEEDTGVTFVLTLPTHYD